MNILKLKSALESFLIEDIGDQDLTSDHLFHKDQQGQLLFRTNQAGVCCGTEFIRVGYQLLDLSIDTKILIQDGSLLAPGDIIAVASGNISHLLKGERVILNMLQRMSGIATLTKEAVSNLNSEHTRICDTRKTTPGLRMFEKYAVTIGGGYNHRHRLDDAVMIKDNHIIASKSITNAVQMIRSSLGHMVNIEVETENKQQIQEAIEAKVDSIMFDNCTPKEIEEYVQLVPPSIVTEVSGGISVKRLADYSHLGVDYISLGCLTHSVSSLDISVDIQDIISY